MFFTVPLGHDRSVTIPWTTIGIGSLCIVVHLVISLQMDSADSRLVQAIYGLDEAIEFNGVGYVSPEMFAPVPSQIRSSFDWLSDYNPNEPADEAVWLAARELYSASVSHPILKYGYRTDRVRWWAPLTNIFLHGGIVHLVGNLVFLWLAGAVIEAYWGVGWFLVLYLVGGVFATFAQHLLGESGAVIIGASGAIAALMGAFIVGFPRSRVKFGYFLWMYAYIRKGTFHMPAWAALGLWFGFNVWDALTDSAGGVAYWAHVGGFVFGAGMALAMQKFGPVLIIDASPVPLR